MLCISTGSNVPTLLNMTKFTIGVGVVVTGSSGDRASEGVMFDLFHLIVNLFSFM